MAKPGSPKYKDMPLQMAGGTNFARYAKQSLEQSFNLIYLDGGWMSPFAGYNMVLSIDPAGTGRNIYSSTVLKKMFAVIDNKLWVIDVNLIPTQAIGLFNTTTTNIFIAENNNGQVFFADGANLYLWTASSNVLSVIAFTSGNGWNYQPTPNYVTFQNGRIIFADSSTNFWYLSGLNNAIFVNSSQTQGALQTKPDNTQACIRFPGKGNLLLVLGKTVTEQWQDVGAQLFPYQRSQSTNIDYGTINPATVDENENMGCWVAGNEKSGLFIAYTEGAGIKKISNEGIDFKLANLTDPTNCYGYLFRQDGHQIYVATWPTDGLSYAYDFNVDKFYTLTDPYNKAYIAKKVSYFNGNYYFVSIVDGNIYQMSSNIYSYNYGNGMNFEIPRVRIPPPIYLPDQSRFVAGYSGFTVEQGQFDYDYRDTTFILGTQLRNAVGTQALFPRQQAIGGGHNYRRYVPSIALSLSKDGGINFGNDVHIEMRPNGIRQNRVMWRQLGQSNYLMQKFSFWGFSHFLLTDGITGIKQ